MKKLRWRLIAFAAIGFCQFMRFLPLSWARTFGRTLARTICRIVPGVQGKAMKNLGHAFGDSLTRTEKQRILRSVYNNIGTVLAEFAHTADTQSSEARGWFSIEGTENVNDPDRGMLMVGAHMANWEWLAASCSHYGKPIYEVVRPLNDPWLDDYVDRTRRSGNIGTINRYSAGREILNRIGEGGVVGILIDQNPRDNAVPVTFFGKECWATAAPAMIALRARCPLHVVTLRRRDDGGYVFRFSPQIPTEKTGDLRADMVRISQACQDELEAHIREYPGQWLWLNDRWKPRPYLADKWARRSK